MSDSTDDDTLPPDDDSPSHTLARFRQLLRQRRDESAARQLDASDRLYTAQVRASKATLPEEKLLALVQALTYSAESHLLTLQEGYAYLDRVTTAAQPAEGWADSARRLESVATDWEARLTAAREVWARAGNEIPRQVAEAAGQVLRTTLSEVRAVQRWLIVGMLVIGLVSLGGGLMAWRVYSLLTVGVASGEPPISP